MTTGAISTTRLILAAILAILVYGMIAATLGTLQPYWKNLGLDPQQTANIALAQAIGLIIASVSVGPLVDNKGKKVGLLLGLGLIAIALLALPNVSTYTPIVAFMFLLGLGGGIIVTAANALVSDISEERRASVLNLLNLFFGLGGMLTPFLAANLLSPDPVRSAVQLLYLMGGLTIFTFLVHSMTQMPPPTGERGFKLSEAGQLLGQPTLWLLSLFLFLYVSCEVGVWNWLVRHLMSQGIEQSTAQNILSFGFALGLLIGRVVVARILINVPALTVTLWASVLMAITTYWMLQASSATMAAVAVFCAGLAMAPVFPTTLAITGDAFRRATATAMGIVITSGWIGLAVSSHIIGAIAGGEEARLKTALLVLPAFSVVMIVVNLILRALLAKRHAEAPVA